MHAGGGPTIHTLTQNLIGHVPGLPESSRITIIGGLLMSQALTLFTTPVVYLYFDRLQHWWERVRGVRREPLEPVSSEG